MESIVDQKKKRPRKQLRDTLRASKHREKFDMDPLPPNVILERTIQAYTSARKVDFDEVVESSRWHPQKHGPPFNFEIKLKPPYDFCNPKREFDLHGSILDKLQFNVKAERKPLKNNTATFTEKFVNNILSDPVDLVPDIMMSEFLSKKGVNFQRQLKIQENINNLKTSNLKIHTPVKNTLKTDLERLGGGVVVGLIG